MIDIQNDFTRASGRMPVDIAQADEIIDNINTIIGAEHAHGIMPTYIGNEFSKYDPLNLFRNFCSMHGSEGSKLDARLRVTNNFYFSKKQGSAFSNPAFTSCLQKHEINHVYLSGLYAENCVCATFKSANKRGLACSVIGDAIASKTNRRRQSMINKYAALGAEIISTATVITL